MKGLELPTMDADAVARLVRALGGHRYVAGRLHLVHALVFDAVAELGGPDLEDAIAWCRTVLGSADIDRGSRDERLMRRTTDRELAAALAAIWGKSEAAVGARRRLQASLASVDCVVSSGPLFDEGREGDLFPVLVDAGWELLPLAALDPERHRGAINALNDEADDPLGFEAARFEEESGEPRPVYLQELSALGPRELLEGAHDGTLVAPLVLWSEGPDAYHDYVVRGALRAAKIEADA